MEVIRTEAAGYGVTTRLLHWSMAALIFGLFGLGIWMVELDYYSPYYTRAPDWHRALGLLTLALLVARFAWALTGMRREREGADLELSNLERRAALGVQWSFYMLLLALSISGYLIATTDGRPIDIFGLFSVPSIVTDRALTDTAGWVHRWLAYGVIALALLHTAAALKHHFIDRNNVLMRMLTGSPRAKD